MILYIAHHGDTEAAEKVRAIKPSELPNGGTAASAIWRSSLRPAGMMAGMSLRTLRRRKKVIGYLAASIAATLAGGMTALLVALILGQMFDVLSPPYSYVPVFGEVMLGAAIGAATFRAMQRAMRR